MNKNSEPKRSAASWLMELAEGQRGEYALSILAALHNSRCSRLCVGAYLNVGVVLSVPICGLGEIVLFTAAHGISAEPITRRVGKVPPKRPVIVPLESDHRAGRGIDRLPA